MSIEHLISRFGYPALVVGLLLEGESVLVLAAFIAHRGHLSLPLVISTAFLVTFASDQFFFWAGRTRGQQLLERKPGWKPNVEKARLRMHGNMTLLFIGFRFMYGLRTVLPFVFGMSRFDPKRFAVLNAIGVFLWALFFGIAGYLFGHLMQLLLSDVSKYETWLIILILVPGLLYWLHQWYANRKGTGSN